MCPRGSEAPPAPPTPDQAKPALEPAPPPHFRTPAPTGSHRPAEVELAGGEGAAVTKRWGELMSQRSKMPPSTEESGSTSRLCRTPTALPNVQAGSCFPPGGSRILPEA
ncbi:hypothetical protein MG293_019231 [Ovis ammon polii]|uniref:Uncharacterized protein n=1 Tax=Ovis ammon polii TaxID=230172 RepID=A0AAD4TLJ9_OVIAM|nr:hypothetical protein MG293_019231 [Ovis ammon polii]